MSRAISSRLTRPTGRGSSASRADWVQRGVNRDAPYGCAFDHATERACMLCASICKLAPLQRERIRPMRLQSKIAVVTGGATGIGRALCRRFKQEGAVGIVVADIDAEGATEVAREVGGLAVKTNVVVEAEVVQLVKAAIGK